MSDKVDDLVKHLQDDEENDDEEENEDDEEEELHAEEDRLNSGTDRDDLSDANDQTSAGFMPPGTAEE